MDRAIHWDLVALKLRKHRSFREIEKMTGVSRVHISRLSRGEVDQPKFEEGLRLLDMASDLLPDNEFQALRVDGCEF